MYAFSKLPASFLKLKLFKISVENIPFRNYALLRAGFKMKDRPPWSMEMASVLKGVATRQALWIGEDWRPSHWFFQTTRFCPKSLFFDLLNKQDSHRHHSQSKCNFVLALRLPDVLQAFFYPETRDVAQTEASSSHQDASAVLLRLYLVSSLCPFLSTLCSGSKITLILCLISECSFHFKAST